MDALMARRRNRLTVAFTKSILKPGRYGDGDNLALKVSPGGSKSWVFRYTSPVTGKQHFPGLGSLKDVSLMEARDKADAYRKLHRDGVDVLTYQKRSKSQRQLDAARTITFRDCALKYLPTRPKGRNAKADAQWQSTLETYAFPIIGDVVVDQIDVRLIHAVLEPIWKTKHETAKRLLGRIRTVLDWAAAHEYRHGDNPAKYEGRLKILLGDVKVIVEHQPALHFRDVPEFMAELRSLPGITARALEFTILCAVRTGATRFVRRSDIDLKERIWTVPFNKPHAKISDGNDRIVPLSDRVVEIIEQCPTEAASSYLFIGKASHSPLSEDDLRQFLKKMPFYQRRLEIDPNFKCTTHGFRSTFDDWATDADYNTQTINFALWHGIDDKTVAAYRRGTQVQKRGQLMQHWADYCAGQSSAKVFSIVKGSR